VVVSTIWSEDSVRGNSMPDMVNEELDHIKLEKSEELLRAIFNASNEIISVSTIFGEFVEVNQAFCEACGKTREELIGSSGEASTLWVDLAKREEFLQILGRQGSVSCLKADMRHANGQVHNCLLSAKVLKVRGAPLVLTIAQDVSNACK
jgi:PAS domain S-box-containing protein